MVCSLGTGISKLPRRILKAAEAENNWSVAPPLITDDNESDEEPRCSLVLLRGVGVYALEGNRHTNEQNLTLLRKKCQVRVSGEVVHCKDTVFFK